MPARFVYWMNVSLDGFIESRSGQNGDLGGPEWVRIDEQLHRFFNERARAMTMAVEGRVIHDMMDPFWPDARSDESLPDYMREYGEIWTEQRKVLVSRSRTAADHNTTIINEDAITRLAELRAGSEGDIGVGGADLATQLLTAGLLDELMLFTHPAVLGAGRPLFDSPADAIRQPLQLELLEQRSFDSGVVMHRYAITRE
ncbi:dihydrofolate reductase family protein [Curtobacterium pusillum]|uniref:Deaminase n=1 Tax=Curtobacterium pusillum TaxID=69373 RepID=A0AAW3T8Z4_9MICO|nr:dihydrofolate reductase family protein [Curtobacterium pusillum]MBA8991589.1 dihydrofolate reductase [Curtobacterium pusillum]NUU14254.1 deaminase [Curtobacterium pusillum]GLK30637.1 deaminase [Curtobacterium pusillum]